MKSSNGIIILAAVLVVILVVSIGAFSACDGIGDSALPSDPEDVTLPMAKSELDYSALNRELVDSVNAAWMARTGGNEPMIESLDKLLMGSGFYYEYLGEYNGYKFFTHSEMTITGDSDAVNVANHEFIGSWQFTILGYKDETLYDINDLYENGEISYVDISEMHDRYCEAFNYTLKYDHVKDKTVTVPGVIAVKLSSDAETGLKQKIASEHLLQYSGDASEEDVIIINYYGKYNGKYNGIFFFTYKSPLKEYGLNLRYEDVADTCFIYPNGNRIYGCDGNNIYTLTEAYTDGLITDTDVASIKKYYTAYHPFVVDEYCQDYSGTPIDISPSSQNN